MLPTTWVQSRFSYRDSILVWQDCNCTFPLQWSGTYSYRNFVAVFSQIDTFHISHQQCPKLMCCIITILSFGFDIRYRVRLAGRECLQNTHEDSMMYIMPCLMPVDHFLLCLEDFMEGHVSKELLVMQGTDLSWTGSQWSMGIGSWFKNFLHNVLDNIQCRRLYWDRKLTRQARKIAQYVVWKSG
jgi:hypothetical protein